jgi:hypothetical protein
MELIDTAINVLSVPSISLGLAYLALLLASTFELYG